jgi:acetylornithine deacetylase/succinyl-diaminopimelate desuccinylase-like protein
MSLIESYRSYADAVWADSILAALQEYITIPNVSPAYASDWADTGHMARAVELVRNWCAERPLAGIRVEVRELPGRTPIILIDVPAFGDGSNDRTVLMYGHVDKQPEMVGWREGLGPWTPVIENERLFGRGGGDDGYAAFASLTALEAVQASGASHHRCVVLIEASEESGSTDLEAHLAALGDTIGTPELVVCLDSGCLDYERLWVTTSLRGLVVGTLAVEILEEGVHSGEASGVVPSSFRIARSLLDRLEDPATGSLVGPALHVEIPADRIEQARATAREFPTPIGDHFPFVAGASPAVVDPVEQLLARTWRPALSVVGADGLPPTAAAGNVLRPSTSLRLSLRIPPTCDHEAALRAVETVLTTDVPYGAIARFERSHSAPGWNAPSFDSWLDRALDDASVAIFGSPSRAFGEGGSIPFIGMLGERFPDAQFVVTGVLGPGSNAHGPNEYLDIPTAKRLTACLAHLLDAHVTYPRE